LVHTSICLHSLTYYILPPTTTHANHTLSLHDALPIYQIPSLLVTFEIEVEINLVEDFPAVGLVGVLAAHVHTSWPADAVGVSTRSAEHTSELQSLTNLVCRLLLVKAKAVQRTKIMKSI